jgi:hypothetical protein
MNELNRTSLPYKLHVIFDGEKGKLFNHINTYDCDVVCIDVKSNQRSLQYCYEYADKLDNDIYFLEDDYVHKCESLDILHEGLVKFGLVTGYDHTDRYTRDDDVPRHQERIDVTESCHWRTGESTTCTWACTRSVYDKISSASKSFLLNDRALFRMIHSNLGIRLWTPLPGITTHCNKYFLSKFTSWEDV